MEEFVASYILVGAVRGCTGWQPNSNTEIPENWFA
jgi:hypothetical protein